MSLENEIVKASNGISATSYPMSIGELISLYRDKEIDLHPEYQRLLRWDIQQKSKFIESILLGIPIPSIVVYQRDDAVWEVIDGLQRLSTIFEFVGILGDENGQIEPKSLIGTDYLPSLEGKRWQSPDDDDENAEHFFTTSQRMAFKRAKIDVSIFYKKNDPDIRYRLFQRLNAGGTKLSHQEARNYILQMINAKMVRLTKELANFEPFNACIVSSVHPKLIEEQYGVELVSKFFVYRTLEKKRMKNIHDFDEFLTEKMIELARSKKFEAEKESDIFRKTFQLVWNACKHQAFLKYVANEDRYEGGFSIGAYEAITSGISANIEQWHYEDEEHRLLQQKIKELWGDKRFISVSDSKNDFDRIRVLIPFGKEFFRHETIKNS